MYVCLSLNPILFFCLFLNVALILLGSVFLIWKLLCLKCSTTLNVFIASSVKLNTLQNNKKFLFFLFFCWCMVGGKAILFFRIRLYSRRMRAYPWYLRMMLAATLHYTICHNFIWEVSNKLFQFSIPYLLFDFSLSLFFFCLPFKNISSHTVQLSWV